MSPSLLDLASRLRLDGLAYRLWRYNPVGLYRLYQHHRFDRLHGVETRGYGDPRYEPTPAPVLEKILAPLGLELERFVFIDIGSGKGKVLLLASALPFKRIVGVERFADLHAVAVRNVAAAGVAERGASVELVLADAAEYALPDEPSILYFFNPFPEDVLARVRTNIERSLAASPRPLYVVYYAPISRRGAPWDRRRVFDASPSLETVQDSRTATVYRSRSTELRHGR